MRLNISLRMIVLALAISLPAAQACMSCLTGAGGQKAPAAAGCSQATTFLARTSGLSGTETTAYKTMICGMVSDGTWSLLDALYIFATNTTTTANLNLVSTSFTLSAVGAASTFTADRGYTFSGGGFDTGLVLTSAVQYTLNNAAMGACDLTSRTTSQNGYVMGVTQGATSAEFRLLNSGISEFDLNEQNFPGGSVTNAQGTWFLNRVPGPSLKLYQNGSVSASDTGAVNSVPTTSSVYIGGRNSGGFNQGITDQLGAAWIGGGFTAGNVTSFTSRISTFITAVGGSGC